MNPATTPRPRPPGRVGKRASLVVPVEDLPSDLFGANDYTPSETMSPDLGEMNEDWMNGRTKEELATLLLKADGLIRRREQELTVAATVGKQLLQSNAILKQEHDALLARFPTTPVRDPFYVPDRPDVKRSDSAWVSDDDTDTTAVESFNSSLHDRPKRRKSSRVMASPSTLTYLSTQNDLLMARLAAIEKETSEAEKMGKENLRALEKEIGGLKAELEQSRQRARELEEQVRSQSVVKEARAKAERIRKMRGASGPSTPSSEPAHDFAPPSSHSFTTLPRRSQSRRRSLMPMDTDSPTDYDPDSESVTDLTLVKQQEAQAFDEEVLRTELNRKIAQLETANREMVANHLETTARLEHATNEANALRKVFETLEREENLDLHESLNAEWSVQSPSFSESKGKSRTWTRSSATRGSGNRSQIWLQKSSHARRPLATSLFQTPPPSPSKSRKLLPQTERLKTSLRTRASVPTLSAELSKALRSTPLSKTPSLANLRIEESDDTPYPLTEAHIDAAFQSLQTSFPESELQDPFQLSSPSSPSDPPYRETSIEAQNEPDSSTLRRRHHLRQISTESSTFSDRKLYTPSRRGSVVDYKSSPVVEDADLITDDQNLSSLLSMSDVRILERRESEKNWTSVVIEFWILLQFLVVFFVFVWSVAKRGPRGVIGSRN
ncbi:hypothetical protein SISNIDRAFT_449420 [Sistotremastrum niveocremeum HHB9708]|uniref:Uncharacterized protein n=1 Tax=Sistotremastrum niveocremeum HHB9708 TaxID=1314777 RepID=A0A164ZL88_9AGAM|nr:hypothetical protein SISNIDRAFT_449420 [Sistotremastrum niveocremeum HHB9708]